MSETTRRHVLAGAAGLGALIGFRRPALAASDPSTWITQLASFKINEERADEAVEVLSTLAAAVEEHEPGVLAYIPHRSAKDSAQIVFFEIYENEAALQAHGQTEHMGALRTNFGQLFLPPVDITRLDRIGGFSR